MALLKSRNSVHGIWVWSRYLRTALLYLCGFSFPLMHATNSFAESGKQLFDQHCMQCHSIGNGRLVGPDLKGITEKRKKDWLLNFIQSPQKMIDANDPIAKSLVTEYKMVMPDQALSTAQVQGIIDYIGQAGSTTAVAKPANTAPAQQVSPASIHAGSMLFTGETRFSRGGAACISCHAVRSSLVEIPGGKLAINLTHVYATLSAAGIRSMIANPPFPPMAAAYSQHPVSDAEAADLIDFLQYTDANSATKINGNSNEGMLIAGGAGMLIILAGLNYIWSRRKRRSTKENIYARQAKTH